MTDVLREAARAVPPIDEHLHQRKRMRAVKHATRRIEKFRPLTEKRLERDGFIRRGKRVEQVSAIAPRRKRKHSIKQPIRWLDERRAGSDMRFFSINHLQKDCAQKFALD